MAAVGATGPPESVVSGGVASTEKAGSVTKCVPSIWSRTLQAPSLLGLNGTQAPL